LHETWQQHAICSRSDDLVWLCPLIKQIWFSLLTFEAIFDSQNGKKIELRDQTGATKTLNLKFLIGLE
jgi:hypothetical protein